MVLMKKYVRLSLITLLPFLLCSCVNKKSDTPVDNKEYNVLFIGNSFTYFNDMPTIVNKIASDAGVSIKMNTMMYATGAHTLLEDCDYNDSLGRKIQDDLKVNQYTDIILQDKSNYPYNHYNEFCDGIEGMKNIIEKSQQNARISLYETWGYNSESLTKPIPEMEALIRNNTKLAARKFGGLNICYVGEAFTYIYENYSSYNLFGSDNKHPNYLGSYLAALVFVSSLSEKHITNVAYRGEEGKVNAQGNNAWVSETEQRVLIEVAEKIVFGTHE